MSEGDGQSALVVRLHREGIRRPDRDLPQELADELEGCPPPPGPNPWQILDETSPASAEYGQTIDVHVRLGFEALAQYVVQTYKRHYRLRKEEQQLTQAASYYKAVGAA
jgi:hypothetical protein